MTDQHFTCRVCKSDDCQRLVRHRAWSAGNCAWDSYLEAEEECLERKKEIADVDSIFGDGGDYADK